MDMDEASWIDQAKKLVEYRREAQEFLARIGQRFDAAPHHAKSISRLWFEADQLDALICGLLEEINEGLLGGQAELDVTRGASLRPNVDEDTLFYDCTWSLLWGEGKGLIVSFAIEPETGADFGSGRGRETFIPYGGGGFEGCSKIYLRCGSSCGRDRFARLIKRNAADYI